MSKLFGFDIDRNFLIIRFFGIKIALKLKKTTSYIDTTGFAVPIKDIASALYGDSKATLLNKLQKYPLSKPKGKKINGLVTMNTLAKRGGAAKIAYTIADGIGRNKIKSTFLVSGIYETLEDERYVNFLPVSSVSEYNFVHNINEISGFQDFFFYSSFDIKNKEAFKNADVLHLHNLHSEYFSLFALPELTALKPTVWTLHDTLSFTGHCGNPLDCNKWEDEECVDCPYLDLYQGIPFDTANFIYENKKKIYENMASDLVLVAPSQWLIDCVKKSILKDKDICLIYNGIDENIFKPYDKVSMRKELNLPRDKKILMFACDGGTTSPWKGGEYITKVYKHLSSNKDLFFMVIGEGNEAVLENGNYLKLPYVEDENILAKYYSASDLFIYPSKADSFGLVVAESLACSTPVIAFNVGGIPEVIDHMDTGYVANFPDINDFLYGIDLFLNDDKLRINASIKARELVIKKFAKQIMIDQYMKLYEEVFENRKNIR